MRLNFDETHLVPWRGEGEDPETVVEGVLYQFMTGTVVELWQVFISVLKQQQSHLESLDGDVHVDAGMAVYSNLFLRSGWVFQKF